MWLSSGIVEIFGHDLLPVTTENLCFDVGGKRILDRVNLSISIEGVSVVLGSNGAGKSVLLRLLHGLLVPSVGKIKWGGRAGLTQLC